MANLSATETELLRPSVLKEGHLLKLRRTMLKLPKLNYYVLRPSGVYCFEGKHELEISNEARAFIPLEEMSLSLGTTVEANSPLHCIKIADRRKVHMLACHSKEIRDSWVTAILTAVAQRLVSEPASRRKRFGSTDSEVFCAEPPSQFTSPFWENQVGQKRSRSRKWSRMSVPEAVLEKTSFSMRNKKKNLSKSFSLEDIHSIFRGAQKTPPILRRKHSTNDLTRHLWSNSEKPTKNGDDGGDASKTQEAHVGHKVSGKKRWSIFGMAASLGFPAFWDSNSDRKQGYDTKQHESSHTDSSPLCDTKL